MESSPAAMQMASPPPPSRSRDSRLLVGFDLPASWGYRRPMAFCKDPDAPPTPTLAAAAAAGADAQQQTNGSRSPTKGAAAEDSPRAQCYQLRDRRAGRDSAEDAREHKKLWNMDGCAAPGCSKWSGGFSLQLSKQEIEADFLAITGRRPPRRHKRRPKSVQGQINSLCPGKSLPDVNRDRYKVNEKGGF